MISYLLVPSGGSFDFCFSVRSITTFGTLLRSIRLAVCTIAVAISTSFGSVLRAARHTVHLTAGLPRFFSSSKLTLQSLHTAVDMRFLSISELVLNHDLLNSSQPNALPCDVSARLDKNHA